MVGLSLGGLIVDKGFNVRLNAVLDAKAPAMAISSSVAPALPAVAALVVARAAAAGGRRRMAASMARVSSIWIDPFDSFPAE